MGGDIIRIKTPVKDADAIARRFGFVRKAEMNDGFLIMSVENARRNLPVVLQSIEAESAEFASPTLNDVFIRLTGRNIKEESEGGFMEKFAKYD